MAILRELQLVVTWLQFTEFYVIKLLYYNLLENCDGDTNLWVCDVNNSLGVGQYTLIRLYAKPCQVR